MSDRYDVAIIGAGFAGLAPMRAFAQLVYFHRKGLKSGAAWRDLFRRDR